VGYAPLIDTLIEVLKRLKKESPAFQGDALWKIGDYIAETVEEGEIPDADRLLEALRAFHRAVEAMAGMEE